LAAKDMCSAAEVVTRVEPGKHLSLFLGQRTLNSAWKDIAHWINNAISASRRSVKR